MAISPSKRLARDAVRGIDTKPVKKQLGEIPGEIGMPYWAADNLAALPVPHQGLIPGPRKDLAIGQFHRTGDGVRMPVENSEQGAAVPIPQA